MAEDIIFKDTDTPVTIVIKTDEEPSVVIDLTGYTGILVRVFQDNGIDIDKFSKNAQTGFRTLDVTDAVNGEIMIYLNADNVNQGIVDEPLFYEVKLQLVNAKFDSGTQDKSGGKKRFAILEETTLKNESFS